MEIERKWLVSGLPGVFLPVVMEQEMEQGYLTVRPTVRIRKEAEKGGKTEYVLCLKSGAGIARQEIEISVSADTYDEIAAMIGLPLIPKTRITYRMPDGLLLEVNHVDSGLKTEFWYAEVEFGTVEQAKGWDPGSVGLDDYLTREVTYEPGQSMGAYWIRTRGLDS